jgi:hypothetical protein
MDGGVVDRVGLKAWRQRRRDQARQLYGGGLNEAGDEACMLPPCLVHVIERSSSFSGDDDVEASGEPGVQVRTNHIPHPGPFL